MLLLCALLTAPAHALQRPQSGPLLELGVGAALARRGPSFASQLSLGLWRGPYDRDYALGRFWALLVTYRLDVRADHVRHTPTLELRRAVDLVVLAPFWSVSAGPLFAATPPQPVEVGAAARLGGGLKFRRSRTLGFTARIEAGADWIGQRLHPAVGLTLGVGWSQPWRRPGGAS